MQKIGSRKLHPNYPYSQVSVRYILEAVIDILNLTEDSIGYSRTDMSFMINFIKGHLGEFENMKFELQYMKKFYKEHECP